MQHYTDEEIAKWQKLFTAGKAESDIATECNVPVATVRYHCRAARELATNDGTLTDVQQRKAGRPSPVTADQRELIRAEYIATGAYCAIARKYKLSPDQLRRIVFDLIGTR